MKSLILSLLLLTSIQPQAFALSETEAMRIEAKDRAVDRAAVAAQDAAILSLEMLSQRYKGSRKEAEFLSRLGDLYMKRAKISFRIAHGESQMENSEPNLSEQKKSLRQALKNYNKLIKRFPKFKDTANAYFFRAKAYQELKNKKLALFNYHHLIKNYPDNENKLDAHMAIADYAISDNLHETAIRHLKAIEKNSSSSLYPFALYKLAWSHYNLQKIDSGINYLERHLKTFKKKKLSTSDIAIREHTLLDITAFYLEGLEKNKAKYSIQRAIPYFKKVSQNRGFGSMILRFARLLRSHDHTDYLIQYKDRYISRYASSSESIEVALITFDYVVNKRKYEKLSQLSNDFVLIHEKVKDHPKIKDAQTRIVQVADLLQKTIIQNKNATAIKKYTRVLANLYSSFVKIVPNTDPRIPRTHYNLAETLFAIGDYSEATIHYRWIMVNSDVKWDEEHPEIKISRDTASLRAIASRYEVFRKKKLLPRKIVAKSLLQDRPKKRISPMKAEWIKWVDTHVKNSKMIDQFYFEAARIMYAEKRISDSLVRLNVIANEHTDSKVASSSAKLILDTYIASHNWDKVHRVAKLFEASSNWKEKGFKSKLKKTAADAAFRGIEVSRKRKEYQDVIDRSEKFESEFEDSPHLDKIRLTKAEAAEKENELDIAISSYSQIIEKKKESKNREIALLRRGDLYQKRYLFLKAASDYSDFLHLKSPSSKLSKKELLGLKKSILLYYWFSRENDQLSRALNDKRICSKKLLVLCDQYEALLGLNDSEFIKSNKNKTPFYHARKGYKKNRAIWALLALKNTDDQYPLPDRLLLVHRVSTHWKQVDPMIQMALLKILSTEIPRSFKLNRERINRYAKLKPTEDRIKRRISLIRDIERSATRVAKKVPWAKIKALVLNEVASLYLEFARELNELPTPEGLQGDELASYQEMIRKIVIPFEDKGQDIRSSALDFAIHQQVDQDTLEEISAPFFNDNPSQTEAYRKKIRSMDNRSINVKLADQMDPNPIWRRLDPDSSDSIKAMVARWSQASEDESFEKMAYYVQCIGRAETTPKRTLALVRAISLAALDAKAEALTSIQRIQKTHLKKLAKNTK